MRNRGLSSIELIIILIIVAVASLFIPAYLSRPSVTQLIPNPPIFLVTYPLKFTTGTENQYEIIVPRGFITDLASIPRALWWWQAPHEATMAPAILHDFLYWLQPCTKEEADAVMYLAMSKTGMSQSSMKSIHKALRAFGNTAWKQNKEANNNGEKRFFSESYTARLIDGNIDPQTTLSSIQADAVSVDNSFSPNFPIDKIKETCSIALTEFQQLDR